MKENNKLDQRIIKIIIEYSFWNVYVPRITHDKDSDEYRKEMDFYNEAKKKFRHKYGDPPLGLIEVYRPVFNPIDYLYLSLE